MMDNQLILGINWAVVVFNLIFGSLMIGMPFGILNVLFGCFWLAVITIPLTLDYQDTKSNIGKSES